MLDFVADASIPVWFISVFALWDAYVGIEVPSDLGEISGAAFGRRPRGQPANVDPDPSAVNLNLDWVARVG